MPDFFEDFDYNEFNDFEPNMEDRPISDFIDIDDDYYDDDYYYDDEIN